jgi:RNA polymerase Rpb4
MLSYLRSPPSPLGNNPLPYNSTTIRTLLERLRPYELTKAEILVIMNLRPTSRETLSVVVEECDARFPDPDTQDQIVMIIAEVLGTPPDAERAAIKETAEDARERNGGMRAREASEMDVDEP